MGRRSIILSLLALTLLAGIASGSAQSLDLSDDFGTGHFALRRLSAYYPRNFATQIPTSCFKSSYYSPFRIYFKTEAFDPEFTAFIFQLDVSTCPYPKSECCRLMLDHMIVRINSTTKVTKVRLDGQDKDWDMIKEGLIIYRMRVDPAAMRSLQLEIYTAPNVYNFVGDLCPNSRVSGSCDVISFDESKTCCPERSALPYTDFWPNAMPPVNLVPTTAAPPPSPPAYPYLPPPYPPYPNPPSPSPPTPPSPLPPSPLPPSPFPPPPDGWDQCCLDDISSSPYSLKFQGLKRTGSDTAYQFQLLVRKDDTPDFDGTQPGDCTHMSLRDLGVSILKNLHVKKVQFNGTLSDYWTEPAGVSQDAVWLYIKVLKPLAAFDEDYPIDLVITVRGQVDALCPANDFLHSTHACEFIMHGKDGDTQCCPHGATRRAGPFDDCCVDDITKAPYRMQYYKTNYSRVTTVFDFGIQVVPVTNVDVDMEEDAYCDHMTLDSAQIQIFKHVEVVEVRWEDRIMPFNITPATDFANWLNIMNINRFFTDFDPDMPTIFKVSVRGPVRELCPAGWLMDAGGATLCEYALHGVQGNHSCCPHDVTLRGSEGRSCGCRDDLPGTPYRLGYQPAALGNNLTQFNFDLAKIDPTRAVDFDGAPDKQFGAIVSCNDMSIKDIVLVVRNEVQVEAVSFGGFNYTWQVEPYTDDANWLRILDLDYTPSDLPSDQPVPLKVLVSGGSVSELCPASFSFGSQSSCEYVIYGLAGADECCPNGVTSWFNPSLLSATR